MRCSRRAPANEAAGLAGKALGEGAAGVQRRRQAAGRAHVQAGGQPLHRQPLRQARQRAAQARRRHRERAAVRRVQPAEHCLARTQSGGRIVVISRYPYPGAEPA